jgi:hypothetical protein
VLAFVSCWLVVHVLFFRYLGAWGCDTGKEFGVPRDLLAGKLLYRDTFWPYGPFPPYLNAALIAVFGRHADVLLVLSRLLGLGICLAVYRTIRRFAEPWVAAGGALAVLCLSTTSSFFAVPYSFATLWSCLLGLLGMDQIVAFHLDRRTPNRLLWAGLGGALVLLAKFTVFMPLAAAVAVLLWREGSGAEPGRRWQSVWRLGWRFALPPLLGALPVYAFFATRVRWDSFCLQVLGGFHSYNIRHGLFYQFLWRTMTFGDGLGLRGIAGGLLVWGVLVVGAVGPVCWLSRRWRRQQGAGVAGLYALFSLLNLGQMNSTSHVPYVFPALLVAAFWSLSVARIGQPRRRAYALAALQSAMVAGAVLVAGVRLPLLLRKTVRIDTPTASLRVAGPRGEALSRVVAIVQRETVPDEPVAVFTGHDFLCQIVDRPNPLGYYYTLFEPFHYPWAEERFLSRFRASACRILVTTRKESFSYAYILEIPETTRRICSQLFADYEPISGPECLPYVVWRRCP